MARTHANALASEVVQNRLAQRHHLSKALVVSLMKIQYSNKVFVGEKEDPSIWKLVEFLIRVYWSAFNEVDKLISKNIA